jgi:hypothetical protein
MSSDVDILRTKELTATLKVLPTPSSLSTVNILVEITPPSTLGQSMVLAILPSQFDYAKPVTANDPKLFFTQDADLDSAIVAYNSSFLAPSLMPFESITNLTFVGAPSSVPDSSQSLQAALCQMNQTTFTPLKEFNATSLGERLLTGVNMTNVLIKGLGSNTPYQLVFKPKPNVAYLPAYFLTGK